MCSGIFSGFQNFARRLLSATLRPFQDSVDQNLTAQHAVQSDLEYMLSNKKVFFLLKISFEIALLGLLVTPVTEKNKKSTKIRFIVKFTKGNQ